MLKKEDANYPLSKNLSLYRNKMKLTQTIALFFFFLIPLWSQEPEKKETTPSLESKPKTESSKLSNASVDTRLGRGLHIKSEDEKFTFQIRARVQARYSRIAVSEDPKQDTEGFEIRRMRLVFRGNLYGKEWSYYVQFGFSNLDTENRPLAPRDAIINYNQWNFAKISMGQMKVPFNRQRWNSSSALQMVDRSVINGELNLDRDVGINVFSEDLFKANKKFGYNLGIFGGNGRNIGLKSPPGLLYVGKFTYSPFGGMTRNAFGDEENDRLAESDTSRSEKPRLAISLGIAKNKNTDRSRSTVGTTYQSARFDYLHHEVDMLFKWAGFSFMAEYIRRTANTPYKEREDTTTGRLSREYSRSVHGYFVQGGYLFPNFYEISARWGEYWPIGETDPTISYSRERGVGFSKYFSGHDLKIQMDFFHITGSAATLNEQYQFRIQSQVYY